MSTIIVMSHWLAKSFISEYLGDRSKLHAVGTGFNFNTLPAVPERSFECNHLILIGKEFERKGKQLLLKSFQLSQLTTPQLKLTIFGANARKCNTPYVNFVGYLS